MSTGAGTDENAGPDARWWETFYDEHLAHLLLEQTTDDEVQGTIRFLTETLSLNTHTRIYDQCCGNGRLSLPLAALGHEVVGVDQAAIYIDEALRAEAPRTTFFAGDACEVVIDPPCDAVINWWTSFGYATRDEDNVRMLRAAYASLKPGGGFALDFLNVPGIIRHFQRDVVTRRELPDGQVVLLRESRLDLRHGRILKRWTYFLPDGRRVSHDTSVGLYMPHQLVALAAAAGFDHIELWGGTDGSDLTPESPRCILTARRPHA